MLSYFRNLLSVKPEKQITPEVLYDLIQSGKFRRTILKLRATKDKTVYDKIKRQALPVVTISGAFSQRGNDHLIQHSGLIQVDIDEAQLKEASTTYSTLFKRIKKDEYTYMCFRSPGGKGIKVIIKISTDPHEHLRHFYALQKHYHVNLKVDIDPACKDISRGLVLSWDPFIFRNPASKVFTKVLLPKVRSQQIPVQHFWHPAENKSDEETVIQIVSEINKRQIDITVNYETWYRIAFALSDALGENGRSYFHEISQYYAGYNRKQTDALFTNCLRKSKHRIHLGTLVYLARQAGLI